MQIKGKGAIVTGGASGLGAATVRQLHSAGARVYIADLNQEAGTNLASELGPQAVFIKTDVSSKSSMEQAVNAAVEQHGALHLLVNCAGIALAEKVLNKEQPHDLDHFTQVLQVNLIGTFNALRLSAAATTARPPSKGSSATQPWNAPFARSSMIRICGPAASSQAAASARAASWGRTPEPM